MVYIIIVLASAIYPWAGITATTIILASFFFMAYKNITLKGKDMNMMFLLSFAVPGLGLVYIGATKEGTKWFIIQVLGFLASAIMIKMGLKGKFIGGTIMIPFLLQLFACAKEYRERFGDGKIIEK